MAEKSGAKKRFEEIPDDYEKVLRETSESQDQLDEVQEEFDRISRLNTECDSFLKSMAASCNRSVRVLTNNPIVVERVGRMDRMNREDFFNTVRLIIRLRGERTYSHCQQLEHAKTQLEVAKTQVRQQEIVREEEAGKLTRMTVELKEVEEQLNRLGSAVDVLSHFNQHEDPLAEAEVPPTVMVSPLSDQIEKLNQADAMLSSLEDQRRTKVEKILQYLKKHRELHHLAEVCSTTDPVKLDLPAVMQELVKIQNDRWSQLDAEQVEIAKEGEDLRRMIKQKEAELVDIEQQIRSNGQPRPTRPGDSLLAAMKHEEQDEMQRIAERIREIDRLKDLAEQKSREMSGCRVKRDDEMVKRLAFESLLSTGMRGEDPDHLDVSAMKERLDGLSYWLSSDHHQKMAVDTWKAELAEFCDDEDPSDDEQKN